MSHACRQENIERYLLLQDLQRRFSGLIGEGSNPVLALSEEEAAALRTVGARDVIGFEYAELRPLLDLTRNAREGAFVAPDPGAASFLLGTAAARAALAAAPDLIACAQAYLDID